MATFQMYVEAGSAPDSYFTAALGVSSVPLTSLDEGKAVKLVASDRYGVVADGDEIEGILAAVEPFTVNNGYGLGSIQRKERFIGKNLGATLAFGEKVVAAAQPAVGTAITEVTSGAQTGVRPTPVKTGTPTTHVWRVISLLGGGGLVNTHVLIERVNA